MRIKKAQITTNRVQNNSALKKINFCSIFQETVPHESYFWHLVEPQHFPEPESMIFQGKLLNKSYESDKWEPYLFEIHPNRIFKKSLHSQQPQTMECAYLGGCFLKKFNHFDSNIPNYKFGFRLQIANKLNYFVSDSSDQFKKWLIMLSRLCILDKFKRKYKVLSQIKYSDPVLGPVCFNCFKLSDASYYLVKIIEKETMYQQQKEIFLKEMKILRKLNHPQLIKLQEIYEDESNLYIVFDQYIGAESKQYFRDISTAINNEYIENHIEERLLSEIIYGLIAALAYMHSKGIFHRDIKLDNIFLPENRRLPFVILGNFSQSESFPLNHSKMNYKKIGTPGYAAPEIFKTSQYDQKIDIFSLGIIFYRMVYDLMPFDGLDSQEILKLNERCEIDFKADKRYCKNISMSGIDLMKGMLQKDPLKRLSSLQALNHHWFIKTKIKETYRQKQQSIAGIEKSLSTIMESSEFDQNNSFFTSSLFKLTHNFPSRNSLTPITPSGSIPMTPQHSKTKLPIHVARTSILVPVLDIPDMEFPDQTVEVKIQNLLGFKQEVIASRKRYQINIQTNTNTASKYIKK